MNTINVIVRKCDGVVFEGNVFAVSSTNEIGPFDVLAMHANFISPVKDYITLTHQNGSKKEIKINTGIISVKENKVEVFLEI